MCPSEFKVLSRGGKEKTAAYFFSNRNICRRRLTEMSNIQHIDIEVPQSCPILWDPMDYSLPGSSVHGIFQARVLEWVAISFCRRSSQTRDRTQVSCIVGRCFTI